MFQLRFGSWLQLRLGFRLGFRLRHVDNRLWLWLSLGLGDSLATRFEGSLRGLLDEHVLRVERSPRVSVFIEVAERAERRIGGIAPQFAQLGGVAHANVDVGEDAPAQLDVEHRPRDLYALVEVARHEVGAAQVDGAVVVGAEAVDAAMLEQAPDDGDDAHVFGGALHAGNEAADSADEQGHFHAGVRRFGNLLDDLLVGDRIRLHEGHGRLASAGERDLLVEVFDQHRLDLQRGDAQHLVVVRDVLELHVAEELDGVASECLVRRDEAQVGVKARGLLVVVAGAELRDVLQSVFGLARDAADLGVHLVIAEAVEDVATRFLEALRPFDVVVLVEACAQLEQRRDFLARVCRRDERFGKVGLPGQAVQRDLDRHDRRVGGRLAQELHERVHALIRVEHERFVLGYLVENAAALVEARGPCRREGFRRELGALGIGKPRAEIPGEAQVERHDGVVHLVAFQPELLQHELFHDRR